MTTTSTTGLGFGLVVYIDWISESGSEKDLTNCVQHELVGDNDAYALPFVGAGSVVVGDDVTMVNGIIDRHYFAKADVDCSTGASGTHAFGQSYMWHDTVMNTAPASCFDDTITYDVEPRYSGQTTAAGYKCTTKITDGSASCLEYGP
jgi:hypothetical protein